MKKLTLIAIAATIVSFGAQGQALVDFRNSAGIASRISTNSIVGGPATGNISGGAGSFYFALFYSANATTVAGATGPVLGTAGTYAFDDSNWHFAGNGGPYNDNGDLFTSSGYATNTATPGLFRGVTADAVGGLPAGGTAQFVVIGWSANIGPTWQQLQTFLTGPTQIGWVGESAVSGPVITGDNEFQPEPVILNANDPMSGGIPGFTLGLVSVVPEPSTMALAGLGGLSLLLFRRRK